MSVSRTAAIRELGRRAIEGNKEALDVLREVSRDAEVPAWARKFAAKLFVDAGGRP